MTLREFVGDDGQEWQVWDTRPTIVPPNVDPLIGELPRFSKKREGGWLTFTAATDRRRLSPIPENWESADDSRLKALLAEADRIRDAD